MEKIKNNDELALKQFEENKSSRNATLQLFEYIAACLIVFIHIRFPGVFGRLVDGLARFGVPLFFTVYGFYLIKPGMTKKELRKKLKTRIIRVTKLLILSFCISFVVSLAIEIFDPTSSSLIDWLNTTFDLKRLLILLILNVPLISGPNWFMLALIYGYVVIYIFVDIFLNNNWIKYLLSSMLLLWIALSFLMNISQPSLFGIELANVCFYRNWFTTALPFLCFGMILNRYKEKIKNISLSWIVAYVNR